MANYVLVYKGGSMAQTDEERARVMKAWEGWFGQLGQALVDGGNPFGPSAAVGPGGSVQNGAPSGLSGYSILKADSLSKASDMAKGCPIVADGGTVEVYETFNVM